MTKRKTWGTISIGLVAKVLPGYAFRSRDFAKEGFPVVKIKNIRSDCTICMNDVDCIPLELISKKYDTYILHDGAMLIAMTGATAGKVGKLRSDTPVLLNQRVAQFKPFNIDEHFFWSVVSSQIYQNVFYRLADGAAQPNMSGKQIESVLIPFPPLPTQRRIASILSAYDDLIENNTRRIAILEEMARRLYEEWFVNFRFPGHETARFVETELGPVPEGWEVVRLEDVTSFISRGISPTYDDNSECRVINQKCIRDRRLNMKLSRGQSKHVPDNKFVTFGDILINSTGVGTLGRISQVYEQLNNTTVDSHVTIARPAATVDIDFFGLKVMSLQDFFTSQGVGSTGQTELSRARVADTKLVVPPFSLQLKFGKTISSCRVLCTKLMAKNANLRAQRDLLLPKLISGELDVSEAEDLIEEADV